MISVWFPGLIRVAPSINRLSFSGVGEQAIKSTAVNTMYVFIGFEDSTKGSEYLSFLDAFAIHRIFKTKDTISSIS